jgi:hypothetical protein
MAGVEKAALSLPVEKAEEAKQQTVRIIRNSSRPNVFSYPTSQYTPVIHYIQLPHISIYSCNPLSYAIPHLNIILLSTVFSYPTSPAILYLQLSHISIYSCYPLSSAIPHLNILLLSTAFSYPTPQYNPAIHYLQLSHISI